MRVAGRAGALTLLQRTLAAVERADLRWLIFGLLLLDTLSLKLDGGEEQYFAMAKAFVDPNWIPGSLSLKDVPGSRIVFDSMVGRALRFLSFEQVALAGRALCALLLAFPLARLVRQLELSNLLALCLLQGLALLGHQSFIGKEWMFGAFESKVIAYAFVFWSLVWRLQRRDSASVACAAAAAWFHILVGGWYAIALFADLLLARVPLRRLAALALLYGAMLAPTTAYLANHYLANNPNVIDGMVASRIYVYFRNPHHLDLIGQLRYPGSEAQVGVALSVLSAALCWRVLVKSRDRSLRDLARFALILFAQQFAALAIAPFDHDGVFLKYYPYRSSALSLLLMLLIVARLWAQPALREGLAARPGVAARSGASQAGRVAGGLLLGLVAALGLKLGVNLHDSLWVLWPPPAEASRRAMYAWIRANTPRDAVILDLDRREPLDFIRRTERESYAVYKFDPTTNRLIHDWYLRVLDRNRAMADIGHALRLAEQQRVGYLLTEAAVEDERFRLAHREPGYWLYVLPGTAR